MGNFYYWHNNNSYIISDIQLIENMLESSSIDDIFSIHSIGNMCLICEKPKFALSAQFLCFVQQNKFP